MQDRILEIEGRFRRNNIRVDGLTKEKGETWEDSENKILEILRNNLEIDDVTVERAHILKPYIKKARALLGQWYVNYLITRIKPGYCESLVA